MNDKARILVVEDDMPLAMMVTFLLTQAGFDVTAAHDGHKAIELASENKFDLITLDVDLPDVSGFEVCGELKQRHISYQTPILFVSGRIDKADRQRAFELGAADFIEKPFDPKNFISRVLSRLEERTPA